MVRSGLMIAATVLLLVAAYSKLACLPEKNSLADTGQPDTMVEWQRPPAANPLSRLIYFDTNRRPGDPMNRVLEEFLRFILSREGQQLILDQAIYIPLRGSQAITSPALLEQGGKP